MRRVRICSSLEAPADADAARMGIRTAAHVRGGPRNEERAATLRRKSADAMARGACRIDRCIFGMLKEWRVLVAMAVCGDNKSTKMEECQAQFFSIARARRWRGGDARWELPLARSCRNRPPRGPPPLLFHCISLISTCMRLPAAGAPL